MGTPEIVTESARASQDIAHVCARLASRETSFSRYNRIKTYRRLSIGQERLSNVALKSIERALTNVLDFDSVNRRVRIIQRQKEQTLVLEQR